MCILWISGKKSVSICINILHYVKNQKNIDIKWNQIKTAVKTELFKNLQLTKKTYVNNR